MIFGQFNQRLLLLCFVIFTIDATTEILRPRGVPFSKKSFYDPGKDFQCLDGSATIPFLLVNDDYCDCDDGSDEPGTNACPNGIFYCSNIGYIEKVIPSSRVNDGICDCCDSSDEYNSSINCENNCLALGEQMRAEREKYLELLKQGNEIRQKYIEEAKQKLEQTKSELESLKPMLLEAEELKNAKLEEKNRAEELEKEALEKHRAEEDRLRKIQEEEENARREAQESERATSIFNTLDLNKDGKLTFEELKTSTKFDRDNDGTVTDEEAKYFLNSANELDLQGFISVSWTLLKHLFDPEAISQPDSLTDLNQESVDDLPHSAYEAEDEHLNNGEEVDDDEPEPPSPPSSVPTSDSVSLEYDDLTSQLIEEAKKARDDFSDAESKFLNAQTKIRELEVLLETDFGPNGEFMALKDECFELHENEYIYKLCPFNSASQRSKSGGSETNLGRWGKWMGSESNQYDRFIMDGGVQCWNGPTRSVIVHLSCSNENVLVRATEPNRCEYSFDFKTPAACVITSSVPESDQTLVHTEL